jgi:hypothetical protein
MPESSIYVENLISFPIKFQGALSMLDYVKWLCLYVRLTDLGPKDCGLN